MHSHLRNRILIMENDGLLVQLYGDVLRHSGYEVHEAPSLSLVREFMNLDTKIDLIICSVQPGYEYRLEFLQQMQPIFQTRGTRLIVINNLGHAINERLESAVVVNDFSSIRELMKLVKQTIGEKQTAREHSGMGA